VSYGQIGCEFTPCLRENSTLIFEVLTYLPNVGSLVHFLDNAMKYHSCLSYCPKNKWPEINILLQFETQHVLYVASSIQTLTVDS